jgi:hypothetical protein
LAAIFEAGARDGGYFSHVCAWSCALDAPGREEVLRDLEQSWAEAAGG